MRHEESDVGPAERIESHKTNPMTCPNQ
jgi:hypothetical protein